jgi:hypothetical protein
MSNARSLVTCRIVFLAALWVCLAVRALAG